MPISLKVTTHKAVSWNDDVSLRRNMKIGLAPGGGGVIRIQPWETDTRNPGQQGCARCLSDWHLYTPWNQGHPHNGIYLWRASTGAVSSRDGWNDRKTEGSSDRVIIFHWPHTRLWHNRSQWNRNMPYRRLSRFSIAPRRIHAAGRTPVCSPWCRSRGAVLCIQSDCPSHWPKNIRN